MAATALQQYLDQHGQFPPVELVIQTLPRIPEVSQTFTLKNFISYTFDSNILVPVDTFSFTFAYPSNADPLPYQIRPGDVAVLWANNTRICTGIIDSTEVEVDGERGEIITINGRNVLSQLEDQNAVSVYSNVIYAEHVSINTVMQQMMQSTRFQQFRLQNFPTPFSINFGTQSGESKLDAIQRYLETPNCLIWSDPNGIAVVGKPNMSQAPSSQIIVSKQQSFSNVLSIRAIDASAMVMNIVIPIYTGQEANIVRIAKQQAVANSMSAPNQLLKAGHVVAKTIMTSNPNGSDPQSLSLGAQYSVLGSNLLQAYAKREIARQNVKVLTVQAVLPGHYDPDANPYLIDSTIKVTFDRGNIDETMYLYGVTYTLTQNAGQKTTLTLCKLGTIVADVPLVNT